MIFEEVDGVEYLELIINRRQLEQISKGGLVIEDKQGLDGTLPINIFIRLLRKEEVQAVL